MTDWKPLLIPIILMVVLGIVLNLIISPFVETTTINPESWLYSSNFADTYFLNPDFVNFYQTDLNFLWTDIKIPWLNPIGILPESFENFFYDQIVIMSYIPNAIIIPFYLIVFISLFYAFVKLMPFT